MKELTRREAIKAAGAAVALGAAESLGFASDRNDSSSKGAAMNAAASDSQPGAGADRQTYLKDLVADLLKSWPANPIINIVCHGHSVLAGYFQTPLVRPFDSYPHLMRVGLADRYPRSVVNVIVTAIGAENAISGAARFERDVLCHQPRLVTIDYANNDRGAGLDKARAAWSSMIEKALAKDVKVLLLTPPLTNYMSPDAPPQKRKELLEHAQQVRDLAAKYQVGLVDATKAFEPVLGNVYDYLSEPFHPNRAGHEIVTRELMRWFPLEPKPI
jgi:lysophospholipase L1-like esterase